MNARVGLSVALAASLGLSASLFETSAQAADRELLVPMGQQKTLVIDQLAGFRISTIEGVGYAGPLGFSLNRVTVKTANNTDITNKYTRFWFAPSADFFVIDHLSVGALIEFAVTNTTSEFQANPNAPVQSVDLPAATSITLLPRVGYLFSFGDRFGIWPRLGVGYASLTRSSANVATTTKETFSGMLFDLDVPFIYRPTEHFFFRIAPELAFTLIGSRAVSSGAVTTSTDASAFNFSVSAGVGVMWDL
ncbi:MAG: hypothetical protein HOO96_20075 [Polyangiaceae bacterium]|nr:hypothetical protein [Polyangiaceae bacterium]